MKKTILLFVSVVVLMIISSSFAVDGTVAGIGNLAPSVKLEKGDVVKSIEDYRGKYLLLTFWSSSDCRSRIKCNQYDSFFNRNMSEDSENRIEFVALNFDRNERIFSEMLNYDNLNPCSQYYADKKEIQQISKAYNLSNGLKSYLIDPYGRIVTVNPDEEQLTKIMCN